MNEKAIYTTALNNINEAIADKAARRSRPGALKSKVNLGGWLRSFLIVGYILTVLVVAGLARA